MFIEIIARFIEKETSRKLANTLLKSLSPALLLLSGSPYGWKQDKVDGTCTLVFIIDQLSRSSIIPRSGKREFHPCITLSFCMVCAGPGHACPPPPPPPPQHLLGVSYFRRGIPYA